MAQQKPPNVLIIGNPGVGKSTLLNGIVGEAKFQAGMSLDGGGVTKILQQCLHDGVNYVDTPGLDDDFSRRECAAEIEKALKLGGLFFVCFVITLESGRIRPNDKSTIRLVLDAAKQIGGQYSVIVNKLETKICDVFQKEPNRFKAMLSRGFPDNIITNSLHFFPHSDGLFNSDNAVFEPESVQGFLDFLKDAPGVVIDPPKVDKVKDEEWEVKFAEYEKVIKELYDQMAKNEAAFRATLEEERKRLNQQLLVVQEQQRQMAAAHKAEMERVKQQVAEAQRQQAEAQRQAAEAAKAHAASVANLNAQAAQQQRELEALRNRPPVVHHHGGGGCCFPSNAICILEDGTKCKISEIKEGQKVLAVDDKGNVIVSEVFFVDGNEDKNPMIRMFYQDHNQTEASLTATAEHLIYASKENCPVADYIKKERPKIANNVEVGDYLFINHNGNMEPRQVSRIVKEEVNGRWAVLTLHHRLLVDNVLVSAYEIDERWGIFDNQSVILLYHLFPSFVASDGFKKFCRGWDGFFDPVIKTMRELF